MNAPFSLAFMRPGAFGLLAAVNLPDGVEAVTEEVLGRLHPLEQAQALRLKGRRQVEFAGGRLAWRALHPQGAALLTGASGEPLVPAGLSVSLTHKRDLAIALVGEAAEGTLGVDLEGDGRARMGIADRVLCPAELEAVGRLEEADRWDSVLVRFAIKEAAYKAIHPHLRRFVGFQEAVVSLSAERAGVEILLRAGEPALALECGWERLPGQRVLASVRARLKA
jgi:enterobactin synthetase component D